MSTVIPPTMDIHLSGSDLRHAMERDVRTGLTAQPKSIPPVYFYDDRGSKLFDEITRLPEYYPTRSERSILDAHAGDIAERSEADTLVELGAGTCEKSRILLDAMQSSGRLVRFVPLDVSDTTLWEAAGALAEEYPGVEVHAVVADFHRHLDQLPTGGRRLFAFLGGTIGNLDPAQRREFFIQLAKVMTMEDRLLLGTDLVKDRARLVNAYDDDAGVTAEFNRNVLVRAQPRAGGRLRPGHVRARGPLERGRPAHRDVAPVTGRPDRPRRRPRTRHRVRVGRGDADRDQHQVLSRCPPDRVE